MGCSGFSLGKTHKGCNCSGFGHGLQPFEQVLRLGIERYVLHTVGLGPPWCKHAMDKIHVSPSEAKLLGPS